MHIELHSDIDAIDADEWDALVGEDQPFLRHGFLAALAHHGAIGGDSGWYPRYLVARDSGRLSGAVPLFLKDHSYGEFVFDWAWADAYQRHGLPYYPKLVVAVPYTPVTGDRILVAPGSTGASADDLRRTLIDATLAQATELGVSSLHWLFTSEADTERLGAQGFMQRAGCQFHWANRDYGGFDDFLGSLSSRNRKKLRAERHAVHAQGIRTEVLAGDAVSPEVWDLFHQFYLSTFIRKGNFAPLTRGFFRELGASLGDRTLLILATHQDRYVAGAFFFRGTDALYGRHWGGREGFHSLHFELCYYRAIEYCIEHGLARFEAGAQGEYKVRRGFGPVETRSAHWIPDQRFSAAIGDFLVHERRAIGDYMMEMAGHLPYRSTHAEA